MFDQGIRDPEPGTLVLRPPSISSLPPSPLGAPRAAKGYEPCPQNPLLTLDPGQKSEPFAENCSWSVQSPNPLLKKTAVAPKVRTLCSKWQLERPKYEPFAQNGSWST